MSRWSPANKGTRTYGIQRHEAKYIKKLSCCYDSRSYCVRRTVYLQSTGCVVWNSRSRCQYLLIYSFRSVFLPFVAAKVSEEVNRKSPNSRNMTVQLTFNSLHWPRAPQYTAYQTDRQTDESIVPIALDRSTNRDHRLKTILLCRALTQNYHFTMGTDEIFLIVIFIKLIIP